MAKHFKITIEVSYDEVLIPCDIEKQLRNNIERCVECNELLHVEYDELLYDTNFGAIIETYNINVKEVA